MSHRNQRMNRVLPPAAVVWLVLTAVAAAPQAQPSPPAQAPPAAALRAIPWPDLEKLENDVREQLAAARAQLESMLADPAADSARRGRHLGELGRLFHAYELFEAAEACYDNARALAPEDYRWTYYPAYLAQTQGRWEDAAALYEAVLVSHPDDLAALVHLGEVRLRLNAHDPAERHFRRALQLDAECAAARFRLGQIALARREYETAIRHLEAVIRLVPEANQVHYPLAMAYRGLGQMERASEHLAKQGKVGIRVADPLIEQLAKLPRGEIIYTLTGQHAYSAGRFAAAAENFRRAAEAAPEAAGPRINLGSALARLRDSEGAMAAYREAIARDPHNVTAHYNLGLLLKAGGKHEEAITHLLPVANARPQDRAARLALAEAMAVTGKTREAAEHYEKLLHLQPQDEGIRLQLTDLLLQLRDYGGARDVLQEGSRRFPTQGRTAHALARLLVAVPDPSLRDGARALELALKVVEAHRTSFHAETVALAYALLGQCANALRWQEIAIEIGRSEKTSPERDAELEALLARYRRGECGPGE